MSYISGDFYTYVSGPDDDEQINFVKTWMPMEIFDELVAMRVAELLEDGMLADAAGRAVENWSGNVGCSALSVLRGLPSWEEIVEAMVAKMREKRGRQLEEKEGDGAHRKD